MREGEGDKERGKEKKEVNWLWCTSAGRALLSKYKALGWIPSSLIPRHLGNEGRVIRVQGQPQPRKPAEQLEARDSVSNKKK